MLTISKDEPQNAERSAYPSGTIGFLISGDRVQNLSPVLTGEDDVHANERVPNIVERYTDRISIG